MIHKPLREPVLQVAPVAWRTVVVLRDQQGIGEPAEPGDSAAGDRIVGDELRLGRHVALLVGSGDHQSRHRIGPERVEHHPGMRLPLPRHDEQEQQRARQTTDRGCDDKRPAREQHSEKTQQTHLTPLATGLEEPFRDDDHVARLDL